MAEETEEIYKLHFLKPFSLEEAMKTPMRGAGDPNWLPNIPNPDTDLTWKKMVKIEPRLGQLLTEVRKIKDSPDNKWFCANIAWYQPEGRGEGRGLKQRLHVLAGWYAANPRLRTSEAYMMAYGKLYEALPNCRGCSCS